jgi:hypothetical protein
MYNVINFVSQTSYIEVTYTFRLDRNTYGGGIMMYFKDNINIVPRIDLQVDGMEAMWFEIKSKVGNISVRVVSPCVGPGFCSISADSNKHNFIKQIIKAILMTLP